MTGKHNGTIQARTQLFFEWIHIWY